MTLFLLQMVAILSTKPVTSCKCGLLATMLSPDAKPCDPLPEGPPFAILSWCTNCTCQICPQVPQIQNCIKPEWKEKCQLMSDITTNETMFSELPIADGVKFGKILSNITKRVIEDCCNNVGIFKQWTTNKCILNNQILFGIQKKNHWMHTYDHNKVKMN